MTETRYKGVKVTTVQLPSGRWNAHSGYGDATAESEAAAVSELRRRIDAGLGEVAAATQRVSERRQRREAREHQYRVRFADGSSVHVTATSGTDAARKARVQRFGRRSSRHSKLEAMGVREPGITETTRI